MAVGQTGPAAFEDPSTGPFLCWLDLIFTWSRKTVIINSNHPFAVEVEGEIFLERGHRTYAYINY